MGQGLEPVRCMNCQRATADPDADGFSYWSDGVGELLPFCRTCAVAEFSSYATTGRDLLTQGRELLMTTKGTLRLPNEGQASKVSIPLGLAQMKYVRTRSLFDGVSLLIGNELSVEAMALTRSLYESSLQLMELASRNDWVPLILGWYIDELQHLRRTLSNAVRVGEKTPSEEVAEAARYDATEAKIRADLRVGGFGEAQRFEPVRALADRHNRNDDYLNYLMAHTVVHGSAAAVQLRAAHVDEKSIRVHQRGGEPWLPLSCIAFAVRSYVHGHRAGCKLFGWDEPHGTDDLLATSHTLDDAIEKLWGTDA